MRDATGLPVRGAESAGSRHARRGPHRDRDLIAHAGHRRCRRRSRRAYRGGRRLPPRSARDADAAGEARAGVRGLARGGVGRSRRHPDSHQRRAPSPWRTLPGNWATWSPAGWLDGGMRNRSRSSSRSVWRLKTWSPRISRSRAPARPDWDRLFPGEAAQRSPSFLSRSCCCTPGPTCAAPRRSRADSSAIREVYAAFSAVVQPRPRPGARPCPPGGAPRSQQFADASRSRDRSSGSISSSGAAA